MTTPVDEHILLDTNVLLTATDESRKNHAVAVAALDEWPRLGATCYTSGQVLREYLVVASRPISSNGLGLEVGQCITNVAAFGGRLRLLEESVKVHQRLLTVLAAVSCHGKQVHDANLVATAVTHGVRAIATQNVSDFARFEDLVHVVPLI